MVDGFSNPNEADDYVAEEDFDEFDEADDDDGKGGSKALTKKLEELKNQALERFDRSRPLREDAQGLRQGRLRHAGLHEGAARPVRKS
jgi:RNA polymerase primary sigma factor